MDNIDISQSIIVNMVNTQVMHANIDCKLCHRNSIDSSTKCNDRIAVAKLAIDIIISSQLRQNRKSITSGQRPQANTTSKFLLRGSQSSRVVKERALLKVVLLLWAFAHTVTLPLTQQAATILAQALTLACGQILNKVGVILKVVGGLVVVLHIRDWIEAPAALG